MSATTAFDPSKYLVIAVHVEVATQPPGYPAGNTIGTILLHEALFLLLKSEHIKIFGRGCVGDLNSCTFLFSVDPEKGREALQHITQFVQEMALGEFAEVAFRDTGRWRAWHPAGKASWMDQFLALAEIRTALERMVARK